jgi:hypothetical protein
MSNADAAKWLRPIDELECETLRNKPSRKCHRRPPGIALFAPPEPLTMGAAGYWNQSRISGIV